MSSFVISDLHLGHENICRNLRNMSAQECNELIVTNWNKIVSKKDKVYILGDVTLDKPDIIRNIVPQLNGFKEVVLGNHDTFRCIKALIESGCKISPALVHHNLLFTHFPVHPKEVLFYKGNVHGHLHVGEHLKKADLEPYYFNVNCELHNYTPIALESIEEYFNKLNNE